MNNTEEFFQTSQGGGLDNDDFTSPGSGAGFDSGQDFIPPPLEQSRSDSDRTNQDNRDDESEDDDFDFDLPFLSFNPDSSIFGNRDYFDVAYYRYKNPDVARNNTGSLRHFKEFGAAEGREFRSTFDSEYYLAQNPDVAAAGVNPYLHFLLTGKSEGREHRGENIIYNPSSRSDDGAPLYSVDDQLPAYYYSNNDIPRYLIDELTGSSLELPNYSTYLFPEDLDFRTSSDNFDRDYYLEQNPDVVATGIDPYSHYLQFGKAERRIPYEGFNLKTNTSALTDFIFNFDRDYYLEQNPDVAAAGIDPAEHYINYGRAEGRNYADLGAFFSQDSLLDMINSLDFNNSANDSMI